ncbi:FHA domain-containing protein [Herpetosiphon gulosus]|uniref:FHA domain-containing protein n=1 Tax=Herpetosiphon gulosus TaxID=1973496 RepID=A0ABP9X506_9CHLR
MTNFEFWQKVKEMGQITYDWWYPTIALPALIWAVSVLFLAIFAARKIKKVHNRFLTLFLSTIPVLLIFPSAYITQALGSALNRVGYTLPENVNDFASNDALVLGNYLNAFGLWGVLGITFTLPLILSSLSRSEVPVISPAIRNATKTITNIATRAFGRRGGAGGGGRINAPYGSITINNGSRKGSIEALRPDFTIGGKGDIQVSDVIVSRTHAKFVLEDNQIAVIDLGSTNGTFLVRDGQGFMLDSQPVPLEHGDMLYLGDPNQDNAVEMVFEFNTGA